MNRRSLLSGLCAMLVGGAFLSVGCSEQGAGNIPEEKVITKERSDDMVKQLEASQKAMGKAPK